MSVLGQALETLKSVLLLQEEVKRLGTNTAKMAEKLDALNTSVTRLEAHSDDALTRAELTAQLAVANELSPIKERLTNIEAFLRTAGTREHAAPQPQIRISSSARKGDAGGTQPIDDPPEQG